MNRARGSSDSDAGASGLDLEAILRLGDPEERGWVPPEFDVIRARATVLSPVVAGRRGPRGGPPSAGSRRRRLVTWVLAAAAVVVALALVVGIVLPSLPRAGVGGQSSASSTRSPGATTSPAPTPTLSAADLAAAARALGVPKDRVVPTEDGAVAVRLGDGQIQLVLAQRSAGSWQAAVIGTTASLAGPAEASATPHLGSSATALLCAHPSLVRTGYIYGSVYLDDGTQLQLVPGPAIGGQVEDQLYVFALTNATVGTEESAVGPGPGPAHLPQGIPPGTFASDRFGPAVACLAP
ncbi:MAG TPA: hypothetical protein VFW92_07130 [Candidatus Limnocylindrales bacterium]|nr:hypothetical protein [Candidatus Limnocylindrales bacterium]